jgi:hypothetical protein
MRAGEPSIHLEDEFGDLMVSTLCLEPGEEWLIVERFRDVLEEISDNLPEPLG